MSLGKRKKSIDEQNNNHSSSNHNSSSVGAVGGAPDEDGVNVEDSGDEGSLSRGEAQRKKKARTTFTGRQIFELEKQFELKKYLSSSERADMAKLLNVTETQVGAPPSALFIDHIQSLIAGPYHPQLKRGSDSIAAFKNIVTIRKLMVDKSVGFGGSSDVPTFDGFVQNIPFEILCGEHKSQRRLID